VAESLLFDSASTISAEGYAPVDVVIGQDLSLTLVNEANGDSIIEDCGCFLNVGPTAGGCRTDLDPVVSKCVRSTYRPMVVLTSDLVAVTIGLQQHKSI
jgi:hypothetical protein